MKGFLLQVIMIIILIPTFFVYAESIVINEIAWMGTKESWADEWIEIYNPTEKTINLSGWILRGEKINFNLFGDIESNEYFLLERTDDKTLPDIKADFIYKGGLSNEGEKISLIDPSGNIVDEIDCSLGWFRGSNLTKRTMERINIHPSSELEGWQTSKLIGGTPKEKNSVKPKNSNSEIQTLSPNLWKEIKSLYPLLQTIGVSSFLTIIAVAFKLKLGKRIKK